MNDIDKDMQGTPCELGIEGCDGSHGPLTEHAHEGFILWKDDRGSIRHRRNLEGFNTRNRSNGTAAVSSDMARMVLEELRETDPSKATVELAKRLIQIASEKNTQQGINAIDRLFALIGARIDAKPSPGERCKTCGRDATGNIVLSFRDPAGLMSDLRRFQELPLDGEDEDDTD